MRTTTMYINEEVSDRLTQSRPSGMHVVQRCSAGEPSLKPGKRLPGTASLATQAFPTRDAVRPSTTLPICVKTVPPSMFVDRDEPPTASIIPRRPRPGPRPRPTRRRASSDEPRGNPFPAIGRTLYRYVTEPATSDIWVSSRLNLRPMAVYAVTPSSGPLGRAMLEHALGLH
ncbi:hypothetical protein LZ30DRAFT_182623 [Colletotrichum cereale]|nr:hypothetical protein LZ30DRAFT_182623 [Colletotrichum cereale]